MPANRKMMQKMAPNAPSGFSRNSRTKNSSTALGRRDEGRRTATVSWAISAISAAPHLGVEPAVTQIDEQVDEHDGDAEHQRHADDRRVIARIDALDQQQAHAGDDEDLLDDDGAGEQ